MLELLVYLDPEAATDLTVMIEFKREFDVGVSTFGTVPGLILMYL